MIDKTLENLGLTSYEIKVYTALVEYGRLNAKDIAKYSKVPPTAVYPNLKTLIEKGFVQKQEEDIAYFIAKDIKTAVNSFIKSRSQELEKIGEEAIENLRQIKSKKQITKEPEIVDVGIGGPASTQMTLSLADNTKKSLFLLGWRFATIRSAYVLLNRFREMVENGKDVRIIIIKKGEHYEKLFKQYKEAGIKIKHYPLNNVSITIKDREECKLTIKSADLPKRINIHIQNKELSKAMEEYFLNIWKKAKDEIYF